MIKVVLFDADGLLINGKMFSEHLAQDYGITTLMTREFFSGVMSDCITGKADLKEILVPYLKEWGWNRSIDEFIHYWHKSEHNIDLELVTYIENLRKSGVTCCLATNQTKYRFEYMLKDMQFEKLFDKVYCSAHLGYRKPDLEFYRKVMKDLPEFNKSEVLFWDDTFKNIEAAKKFGINAQQYDNFKDFKKKMKYLYSL